MTPFLPAHLARECRTDLRGIISQDVTVFVPAPALAAVIGGVMALARTPGVSAARRRRVGDLVVVSVGSGTYHFRIRVAR